LDLSNTIKYININGIITNNQLSAAAVFLVLLVCVLQVYGFTCGCPRCQLEASPEWQQQQFGDDDDDSGWETDDGEEEEEEDAPAAAAAGSESDHAMEESEHQQQLALERLRADIQAAAATAAAAVAVASGKQQQQQQQQQEPLDPAYLSLFMLKYVCPREGCFGTMAAVQGRDGCECSVCGALRSEAEFIAGLEQQQ
jgi:SET and MYND domain-containing protein